MDREWKAAFDALHTALAGVKESLRKEIGDLRTDIRAAFPK